jgi:hypothetical protein
VWFLLKKFKVYLSMCLARVNVTCSEVGCRLERFRQPIVQPLRLVAKCKYLSLVYVGLRLYYLVVQVTLVLSFCSSVVMFVQPYFIIYL